MELGPTIIAFSLTLLAGLSTGIGSLLSMFQKQDSRRFLSLSLGFSAGVMIYLSFMEILPEALSYLENSYGAVKAPIYNLIALFSGVLVVALIDRFVPSKDNPHEIPDVLDLATREKNEKALLLKTGILSAIAITIHNIPEGLATFISYMADPKVGISIAIAIAIHNIPEGIAVAVPIYFATGNRKKSILISFLSGLSESVGAVLGIILLSASNTFAMLGFILAATAGVMIYISFDELLPAAQRYGEHHLAIYGVFSGMAVMGISLILLA